MKSDFNEGNINGTVLPISGYGLVKVSTFTQANAMKFLDYEINKFPFSKVSHVNIDRLSQFRALIRCGIIRF